MIIDAISGTGGGGGTTIVQKPMVTIGTYTYDGTEQGPEIVFTPSSMAKNCVITNATAINAGTYTLTIALKNTAKMVWDDITTADLTYTYTIGKATLTVPTVSDTSKTYNGSAQSPTISGFDSTTMTKSGDSATNAGSYTLLFGLVDGDNYQWSSSTTSFSWSIAKATLTVPTVSGSFTYDGTQKSATITGFDSDTMTKSGDETATNAGTYTVTFGLVDSDNYEFNTTPSGTWSIGKANQTISLSTSSVALNTSNPTAIVTVSGVNTSLSASSNNTSVATVSVSGNTVTISGVNQTNGSATITIYAVSSSNYNQSSSKTVSVTANFYSFPADWLTSGGLNPSSYANLSAVLADEKAVRRLFTIHASVDHLIAHKSQIGTTNLTTILSNNYVAKWINLRDYALDTLYADTTIKGIMDTADKYFYGEWALIDNVWQPKGNVPVMTSNTAPYGEASASSANSGYSAWKAFDGYIGEASDHRWSSIASSDTNRWLQYKSTNPIKVKRITLHPYHGGSFNYTIVLRGSNDGSIWDTLGSIDIIGDGVSGYAQKYTLNVAANNQNYRIYHRITCENYPTNTSAIISALQFYGRELKVSVPTMTSNTAPYGEASAIHSQSDAPPWKAFDGTNSSASDIWSSSTLPNRIYYRFTNTTKIQVIDITTRNSSNTNSPKDIIIQGSNDGINWLNIKSYTIQGSNSNTNTKYTVIVDNSESYLYLGVYISTSYASDGWVSIGMLQFYGLDYSEYDWDTNNPRHYIYDHGVEFDMKLVKGANGDKAENNGHEVILACGPTVGVDNFAVFRNNNGINLTPYNTLVNKVGDIFVPQSGQTYAYGYMAYADEDAIQDNSSTYEGYTFDLGYVGSDNGFGGSLYVYLDVSSINQVAYVGAANCYRQKTASISESWLE